MLLAIGFFLNLNSDKRSLSISIDPSKKKKNLKKRKMLMDWKENSGSRVAFPGQKLLSIRDSKYLFQTGASCVYFIIMNEDGWKRRICVSA